MMRRRKRGSSKYLSIRKRISLSSGRPSPPTKNTYVHTCTRVHAPTLAYGTNTMRGNDGSRSPRVTEYSSMFSLGDSLARYCATFARQRTASARAFFPIFHPPFPSPSPASRAPFSPVPAPICPPLRDRDSSSLVSAHQASRKRGRGSASIASGFPRARDRLPGASRGFPSPCSVRHPVQWTIQFLGTAFVCIAVPRPIST